MQGMHKFLEIQILKKNQGKSIVLVLSLLAMFLFTIGVALHFAEPEHVQNKNARVDNESSIIASDTDPVIQDGKKSIKNKKSLFVEIFGEKTTEEKPVIEKSALEKTVTVQKGVEHEQWLQTSFNQLYASTALAEETQDNPPSLAGRVINQLGEPLDNIEIIAQKRDYFDKKSDSSNSKDGLDNKTGQNLNKKITTATNEDGFYAFRNLPDGIYLLNTFNNKRYLPQSIEAKTGVKYADIVLAELQTLELQGVVNDSSGRALAGVKITPIVKGVPDAKITDEDGKFSLKVNVGNRLKFPLRLQKPGYRKTRFNVKVDDWENHQNLVISMDDSNAIGVVSGVLKGRPNEYLHDFVVHLYSPSLIKTYKAKTDEAGEFIFNNIESANDYSLRIQPKSGYQDFTTNNLKVGAVPIRQVINMKILEGGYRLTGKVFDAADQPMSNITLSLKSINSRSNVIPVTTDENGVYEVDNVPEGELVIKSLSAPFFTFSGIRLHGNNKTQVHNLEADSGKYKLLGKVLDENGKPVAAPHIYISNTQFKNGMQAVSSRSAHADADGKFLFTGLGAKNYVITVNADGFNSSSLHYNTGQSGQIVIRLKREST